MKREGIEPPTFRSGVERAAIAPPLLAHVFRGMLWVLIRFARQNPRKRWWICSQLFILEFENNRLKSVQKSPCLHSGSNRGSFACEANGLTNFPMETDTYYMVTQQILDVFESINFWQMQALLAKKMHMIDPLCRTKNTWKYFCFHPGSNWGSPACQADGLTNFPMKAYAFFRSMTNNNLRTSCTQCQNSFQGRQPGGFKKQFKWW